MFENDKPVALITGGATGIGAACCRALAKEGFLPAVHYNSSEERARSLLEELGEGLLLHADLCDPDDIDRMLVSLKERRTRIGVLVNNAGFSVNMDINSMKLEDFDRQRSLTRGTWYLTKRILRQFMLRENAGRIINISSVTGYTGNSGQIPYTMEKSALDAMTRSLAKELGGRQILINSVAPGYIDTSMTEQLPDDVKGKILSNVPLQRMGTPSEVAEVVAFLATKGAYITGSVFHVNGGLYGG